MQCKMMDLRAPCMDPEFQGMGQGPGNVPEFTVGSCNQEERLPAFAVGRITGNCTRTTKCCSCILKCSLIQIFNETLKEFLNKFS